MSKFDFDKIVFSPLDIDLAFSPLKLESKYPTYVLGAFNPGMTRLSNGNILLMIRVAEALSNPIGTNKVFALRWDIKKGYVVDTYKKDEVDLSDPRQILLKKYLPTPVLALTSISWLLPVEFDSLGKEIIEVHYDKIVSSSAPYQEFGVEDPRITKIGDVFYMTTCSVSSMRQSSTLYMSFDGLNYQLKGIILDHQNKDMLIFEGKIWNMYYALTRPLGSLYFAESPDSEFVPGPSINLAQSPDMLHWKPVENFMIKAQNKSSSLIKVGGGTQPILCDKGWLILFHGVEKDGEVGIYRTYYAYLDRDNPTKILRIDMLNPVLEANSELTKPLEELIYINNVVFTTGIIDAGDYYIVASGELDMCTRLTHIPKSVFS